MDSWFQCSSHLFNWQRTSLQSQNGLYLPRKEIQKHRQILLISNLVTLEQYPAFSVGVSFTQTATKSVGALGTRMIVGQKKDVDYPDELGAQGISNPCFKVYCVRQRYSSRCFLLNNRIQPRTACWSIITLVFSEGFSFNSGGIYLPTIEQNLNSGAKDKFRVRS